MNCQPRAHNTTAKHKLISRHTFCHWCYKLLTRNTATIDHLLPLNEGGEDNIENMVLACDKCNHERGTVTEFLHKLKFELTIDRSTFDKTFKRYRVLCSTLDKWHLLHLIQVPEIADDVHGLMHEFAKSV